MERRGKRRIVEGVAFRKRGQKKENLQERSDLDTVGGGWVGGWGRDKQGALVWGRRVSS